MRSLHREKLKVVTQTDASDGRYVLDDQAGSYWAVASYVLAQQGLIKPGERISTINYNFLRKALPDERPVDAEGYHTNKPLKQHYIDALAGKAEVHPKDKLEDLARLAESAGVTVLGDRSKQQPLPLFHREFVNRTTAERKTQLRRIQDEALIQRAVKEGLLPVTKTPTRNCTWDCDFFTMCHLQENGGDWKTHRQVAFVQLDPYADHRKSTDE